MHDGKFTKTNTKGRTNQTCCISCLRLEPAPLSSCPRLPSFPTCWTLLIRLLDWRVLVLSQGIWLSLCLKKNLNTIKPALNGDIYKSQSFIVIPSQLGLQTLKLTSMQTPALKTDSTYRILLSSFHLPFDPKPGKAFQDSSKSVTVKTD